MAITLTNTAQLNAIVTASAVYTVAVWAKFQTDRSVRLYAFTGIGDYCDINNGVATLQVEGVSVTASVPADNAWHHLALVRSGATTCRAYVDGALITTNTTAAGSAPINFGVFAYPAKTNYVAHLMAWGSALSTTELASQMASYYPVVTPILWLPFADTATLLADFSNSNQAATNIGGGSYSWLADPASPIADPPVIPPDATSAPASAATYTPTAQTISLTNTGNLGAVWVDVEDATGAKLGSGPLQALKWTQTARMDGAGKFSCEILANDPQLAQIVKRRTLRAWTAVNGVVEEIGAGIIDVIATSVASDGTATITIQGDDLLRELTWRSMQGQRLAYQSGGAWVPVTHRQAVTLLDYYAPSTWTLYAAPSPAVDSVYGQFVGESVLQAAVALASVTRTHFYRGTGRTLIFASAFSDCGMQAVQVAGELRPELCAIAELSIEQASYDLIARVHPYGAGQGAARLTLAATTRSAPTGYVLSKQLNYIEHAATVATYGQSLAHLQWPDIAPISNTDPDVENAANALFDTALEFLRDRTERSYPTYRLRLGQCSRVLKPLQSIRVSYLDPNAGLYIDATLNIIEATIEVDADGVRTTGVVVTAGERWPDSDARTVAQAIQGGKQYQAHPQLNANAYVLPFTKNLDEVQANYAAFRFRFDDEVTQLTRVTFDFQLLPLESTVKSVAGTSATTAANGDHTHVVTIAAHTHEMTVTNHTHTVTVTNHTHTVDISAHTHTVTIGTHTHAVPNHTHYIKIAGGSSPTYPIGFGAAGTAGGWVHNASGSDFDYPTNSASGAVTSNSGGGSSPTSSNGSAASPTSSSGGGQTPTSSAGGATTATSSSGGSSTPTSASGGSHTHTITPTITTVYGVYRDSAGNVFALGDLEYSLDGTTWYGFTVGVNGFASLGDSWYRVDLTTLLQAANSYRPKQANNLLRVRRQTSGATGKQCTIDAQLNVRTIIQALALN
jgi:hypothetical protein